MVLYLGGVCVMVGWMILYQKSIYLNSLIMIPPTLFLILAALLSVGMGDDEANRTQAYFLSPYALGQTPEVENALSKIAGQIRVKRTTYNHSTITYILDNITIGTSYNDYKQTVEIPKNDLAKVTGGRIEFTYKFNYTKIENRNNITGYGYGSVLSDPLTYYKELGYCGSFLCWKLLANGKGMDNLTIIQNRFLLKRMDPFNQSDLQNIQDMLDKVFTAIDPANFQVQILDIFNQIFPLALNDTLNHEVFGEKISYVYHSNTHGEIPLNIVHKVYDFGLKPETGFFVRFKTEIQNWAEPVCDDSLPKTPYTITQYGGSQNFLMNCVIEQVVEYLQGNGWLDSALNSDWQSSSFQFYAGDLFDLINNLYLTFSPRAILDGTCVAQKQGLHIFASREFDANGYTLDVTYNCSLKGTNKEGSTTQVLKFRANTKIYIKTGATTRTLEFKIIQGQIINMSFEPVGSYFVSNINLAMFKANSVMANIFNTYTFGTGFPTIVRDLPSTRVDQKVVLFYDKSHLTAKEPLDQ